jgi:hypothetical protein
VHYYAAGYYYAAKGERRPRAEKAFDVTVSTPGAAPESRTANLP